MLLDNASNPRQRPTRSNIVSLCIALCVNVSYSFGADSSNAMAGS